MAPIYTLTVEFATYLRSAPRRPAYFFDTPIPAISPAGKFNTYTTNTPGTYIVPHFNNAYTVY